LSLWRAAARAQLSSSGGGGSSSARALDLGEDSAGGADAGATAAVGLVLNPPQNLELLRVDFLADVVWDVREVDAGWLGRVPLILDHNDPAIVFVDELPKENGLSLPQVLGTQVRVGWEWGGMEGRGGGRGIVAREMGGGGPSRDCFFNGVCVPRSCRLAPHAAPPP
jgi:hypothetical protein